MRHRSSVSPSPRTVARNRRRAVRRWLRVPTWSRRAAAALLALIPILVFGFASGGEVSRSIELPVEPGAVQHTLPALPVISTRFGGVALESYLRRPEVTYDPMDHLMTSSVLRDPDFARAVHGWVEYWTVYATDWFPSFLTRMATGGNAVDSALATRGLPASLRYLPLIESGYDPEVTSRAGAVGLWQLMPTTARGLGLTVTPLVDERRQAEKSTEAALTYLAELHADFGSWFLALAAYNTGPTRVRSVLRRYAPEAPRGDSLFWALRDRFPTETREFVPKLYGAMWVASRPEAYGYEDPIVAADFSPARPH